jgi:UDP-N-acetylmuramyl pentapeptide phosphotransferase/UDP-N-acetylglucosamine-1-phosphate transferase
MDLPTMLALASCGVALVSWCAVAVIRVLAIRWNIVDVPNARSSHSLPVPLCGGIALVVINLAAWISFAFLHQGLSMKHALVFIASAALIAIISFVDDLSHVPYGIRLVAQGVAAALFIAGYAPFNTVSMPVFGTVALGGIGVVLTFLWFIGLTNAYNFMDGIDGMVGGQTIAAGLGWILLGTLTHHSLLVGLGACLAASSTGFLAHNWHPARIFMGDVGATFLGYTFAAITVVAARSDPRLALAGVLLVWPSIFDTGFTVFRRLSRGDNIFAGHRSFLFHRLIHVGWSHAAASTLYIPLPIVGALLAATWEYGSPALHTGVIAAALSFCFALWALVRHQEIRHGATKAFGEQLVAVENDTQQQAS